MEPERPMLEGPITTDGGTVKRRRRRSMAVLAIAAVAVLLTGCLSADQTADASLVNQQRKANRLGALTTDMAAAQKAQAWSARMARTGVLEHTGGGTKVDPSGVTKWCSYGENVGRGSSVAAVHKAFMASRPHKAHILGSFHRLGTGVVKKGSTYWVTEIFLRNC